MTDPAISKSFEDFLATIPRQKIAKASYHCNAVARAIMNHEMFIKEKENGSIEDLDFLQV